MRCETVIPSRTRLNCRSPKKTSWGSTSMLSVYRAEPGQNVQRDVRGPSALQIGTDKRDSLTNPGLSAIRTEPHFLGITSG